MRRYCARSAPWRPPDPRSSTASAMGPGDIPEAPLALPAAATTRNGSRRPPSGRPGAACYLQTLPWRLRLQLFEQQSAFPVQVEPDTRHAASVVVVVLLVDVVVVVVLGAVVVVVVVMGGAVVVVVGRAVVVEVVVMVEVVCVLVGASAATRFRASMLPTARTMSDPTPPLSSPCVP